MRSYGLSLIACLTFCGANAEPMVIPAPQPFGDAELLLPENAEGQYLCIYPAANFLPFLPSGGLIHEVAVRLDESVAADSRAKLSLHSVNLGTTYAHEPVYSTSTSDNQWRTGRMVLNSASLEFEAPNTNTIWLRLKEPYTYYPEEGALALSFSFVVESGGPLLLDASKGYGLFSGNHADWWRGTLAPALSVAFSVSPFAPPSRPVITTGRQHSILFGQLFELALQTSPPADEFSADNLPAWLHLDRSTGLLSGLPRTPGVYSWSVTARNSQGQNSASFNLIVGSIFNWHPEARQGSLAWLDGAQEFRPVIEISGGRTLLDEGKVIGYGILTNVISIGGSDTAPCSCALIAF